MEKERAAHPSILAWSTPRTEVDGARDSDTTDLAGGAHSSPWTVSWQLPVLIPGSPFEFHPRVHLPLRPLHLCADSDPGQGLPSAFHHRSAGPFLGGGAGVTGLVAGWATPACSPLGHWHGCSLGWGRLC